MKLWLLKSHRPEAQCWGLDLFIDSLQCPTSDVCFILHREKSTRQHQNQQNGTIHLQRWERPTNPMRDIRKKLQTAINTPLGFVLAFPDCFCFIQAVCVAAVTICNDSCCSGILEQSWRRADKMQHHCLAPPSPGSLWHPHQQDH